MSDEHPMNTRPPMLNTDAGMEMEVRDVQSRKASVPIQVTVLGMSMETREVQSWKAAPLMPVTPNGTATWPVVASGG